MREHLAILAAAAALACGGRPAPGLAPLATAADALAAGTARSGHTATLLGDGRVLLVGGGTAAAAATAAVELVDPSSGAVHPAAPLAAARRDHSATLLRDGRVLVAGGRDLAGGALATTELYDPAAGTWSAGPALTQARAGHTATRLATGEVLVAGGEAAAPLDGAERLAADTSAWADAGQLGAARRGHAAALLADGTVLVAGGDDGAGPLSSCDRFDPGAGTWNPTAALAAARSGLGLVRLADGTVLAAGGQGAAGALAAAERYEPVGGVWSPAGDLATARAGAAAVLLPSGHVLVTGGSDGAAELATGEVYDPAGGAWAAGPSLAIARAGHTATVLTTGRVLVAGGAAAGAPLAELEALDLLAPAWALTGATASSRRGHTATALPDGRVLVAGGLDGFGGYLANAQLFDPATGLWTDTGAMLAARTDHTATLLETGEVLVVGGAVGSGTPLAAAELYSPPSGLWRATGGLAHARAGHAAALLPSGVVLVAGGETTVGATPAVTPSVELYDPDSGVFVAGASLAGARARHTASLLPGGDVLVAGGQDAAGAPLASCERWSASAWAWSPAQPLAAARAHHAATLLDDGRVLATGGTGADGPLASTELFTAGAGWSAGAPLAAARSEHAAALLPTGDVLVAGGNGGAGDLASAERWDPWTVAWQPVAPLSTGRAGLTLTVLPGGGALAAGGDAGDLAHVGERLEAGLAVDPALAPALDPDLPARTPGTPLALSGARLGDGPEGAGGAPGASAVNHPILRLEGVGGPVAHLAVSSFGPAGVSAAVPTGTTPGWYFVRPFVAGAAGPARALLVLAELRITPGSATVPPRGEVTFSAAGGYGYTWSLRTDASGATVDASTGAYRAGATGGVVDVVLVTDAVGHTATASVAVGPPLVIGDHPGGADPGQTITFTASGGSGAGYAWTLVGGGSGSTLDPVTGVYTAGEVRNSADLVRVTDSLGNVAEVIVYVWPEWKVGGGCGCGTGGSPGSAVVVLLAALALARGRRSRGRGAPLLLAAGLSALALPAAAQETSTSIVLERFEPLGGARDVLSVGSAEVPGHLERGVGVVVSYAARPLRLAAAGDLSFAVVERQATLAAGASVGLFGFAEVAVVGSGAISQSAGRAGNVPAALQPAIAGTGLSDVRVVPKLRLGALGPVAAALAVPVTLPTGDTRSFLGSGDPTYGPRLLVEAGLPGARLLASAGYVIRPDRRYLDATVGSAITYGLAAEVPYHRVAFQASVAGERGSSAAASPLEALLAVRWNGPRGLGVTAGGGPGITAGFGSPEWRAFLALSWSSLAPVRLEPAPAPVEPPPVPVAAVPEPRPKVAQGRRAPAVVPLPPPPLLAIDARVYFGVNEVTYAERFQAEIERVAAEVLANPKPARIVVEGHADEIGNPRHNQSLSEQRAERVRAALEAAGVPAERLRTVGYGDTRPAMAGRHAMNRRVELRIE